MVEDIVKRGLSASEHGVSAVTARKWHGRYLAGGAAALADKSSRPASSPRAIDYCRSIQKPPSYPPH